MCFLNNIRSYTMPFKGVAIIAEHCVYCKEKIGNSMASTYFFPKTFPVVNVIVKIYITRIFSNEDVIKNGNHGKHPN